MLREGVTIGTIGPARAEARPFTEREIALFETFAAQAVIAIENARLFKELNERNAELRTALDQQTATSGVLQVIASSPTELQRVFDTIAESAAHLCDASQATIRLIEGDVLRIAATYGPGAQLFVDDLPLSSTFNIPACF